MAELLGSPLMPSQRYVFDVALEVLPGGDWAYDEVQDWEPRRAGKTYKMRPLVAHRCGSAPDRRVWVTAQKRDSAVRRWREVADLIERAMPAEVRKKISNTFEELRWPRLSSVFQPFTPDEESLHGEDPDLVLLDEWWTVSLDEKALLEQGYEPAFSVKSGQAWKFSAAGTPRSAALREDRARGRAAVAADVREGLACFEWSIPERVGGRPVAELPDAVLLDLVEANHPRAGRGLRRPFLESQLAKGRGAFIRAYGNVDQDDDPGALAIGDTAWTTQLGALIPVGSRVGLGVNADDSGREASVCAGWRDEQGRMHVQVLQSEAGVRWAADYARAVANVGAVAVFNIGRSRDLGDRLDGEVLRLYGPEMAAASARLHDGLVESGEVFHDGHAALERALRAAELPDRKEWRSRSGEPVSCVLAASLAMWAADHLPSESTAYGWGAY